MPQHSTVNHSTTWELCARHTDGCGFESWPERLAGHVCKYVDQKSSTAMLTSIQSAGVAPEVSLMMKKRESMQGIHRGFETLGRCHKKSTAGLSVASQKGLVFSKKI